MKAQYIGNRKITIVEGSKRIKVVPGQIVDLDHPDRFKTKKGDPLFQTEDSLEIRVQQLEKKKAVSII